MHTGDTFTPPELRAFIARFNREEFWESHEVLEAAWRNGRSGFYQGLILLASAYVHVQRGNAHGVVAQLAKAEQALGPYLPAYLGLDVASLVAGAVAAREAVTAAVAEGVASAPLRALVSFPRLAPTTALVRGDEPELRAERTGPPDAPA